MTLYNNPERRVQWGEAKASSVCTSGGGNSLFLIVLEQNAEHLVGDNRDG